jgi:hypothetical protein
MTTLREEFRDVLQKCDDITRLMPQRSFKGTQDPNDIFSLITNYLDINDIILNNTYKGFRGYTEEEKNKLMEENPDRNRNQINTFNPELPEPPERPVDIINTNIIFLKPNLGLVKPYDLINMPLEHRRNNIGDDMYTLEQNITGTVHGILPIGVYRGVYGGPRDKTEIVLESHLELNDGVYTLVSVICYVPGHYVGYYKCNDSEDWIYYNDLGIKGGPKRGGGDCKEEIQSIYDTWISENDFEGLKNEKIIMNVDKKYRKALYKIISESELEIIKSMNTLIEFVIENICTKTVKFKIIRDNFNKWYENTKKGHIQIQWKNISSIINNEVIKSSFKQIENQRIKQFKELRESLKNYYIKSLIASTSNPVSSSSSRSASPVRAVAPFTPPARTGSPASPAKAALPSLPPARTGSPASPAKAALPSLPPARPPLVLRTGPPASPALPPLATRAAKGPSARRATRDLPLYINLGPIDTWMDKPIPAYSHNPRQGATLLFYKKLDL